MYGEHDVSCIMAQRPACTVNGCIVLLSDCLQPYQAANHGRQAATHRTNACTECCKTWHAGKQTGRLKSLMMELRKCCNHPFLMEGQEWPPMQDATLFHQQLVQASGKLALVDAMLERMKDRGHRVLIYSQ